MKKDIFITGSSSGIGFEIANNLSKNKNYKIILNGRNKKKLLKACNKIKDSQYILGDVTSKKSLTKLGKKIKKLDILICNVGNGSSSSKPGSETLNEWKKSFDDNFYSSLNIIKIFEKKLIKTKGMIICISSICGIEYTEGAPITYSVSKSALNTLIKHYSKILGPKGVKLNGVAPGNILFKGSTWEKKIKKNKKKVQEIINSKVSLKKLGSADDVSSIVNYLVSNNSNFINGSIFVVDGGQISSF